MNRLKSTPYTVALAVTAVAICMLAAGGYYTAAVAEYRLGYQAFRAWAFTNAGFTMLAIGCVIGLANFTWRRTRSSGGLSV